jgi:aromatic ring-opening dioxygenase catalytic subunit (LigB family)
LAIGRALQPLRDEGVFIIGSGMTYHNMRAMGPQGRPAASAFDAWLRTAVTLPPSERDAQLGDWQKAPAARAAHPREEHLIPLLVVAGAAGADAGRLAYQGTLMGLEFSGYAFG